MKRQNNKGFSLVELIIVVAIMAILIGVLAPQLIRYIEKGKVSADTQFCDTMHSAITYALMDHDVQMATDGSTYWINELTKPYPGYTLPLCDINTSPLGYRRELSEDVYSVFRILAECFHCSADIINRACDSGLVYCRILQERFGELVKLFALRSESSADFSNRFPNIRHFDIH